MLGGMNLETLIDGRAERRADLPVWYSQVLAAAECEGAAISALAGRLGCTPANLYRWRREEVAVAHGRVRARVAPASSPVAAPSGIRLEVRTRSGRTVRSSRRSLPSLSKA